MPFREGSWTVRGPSRPALGRTWLLPGWPWRRRDRLGLDDLLLVFLVLEEGDELTAGQPVPDVDEELLDPPGDLRDDGEIRLGDERPENVPISRMLPARRPRSRRRPQPRAGRRLGRGREPGDDLPGQKDEKEGGQDGERAGLFRQSLVRSVCQLTFAKTDLARS